MCVVVKRKLQLFYWKKDKFLDFREDITVSDIPRSIEWCEETIVVGFKGEYKLIEVGKHFFVPKRWINFFLLDFWEAR